MPVLSPLVSHCPKTYCAVQPSLAATKVTHEAASPAGCIRGVVVIPRHGSPPRHRRGRRESRHWVLRLLRDGFLPGAGDPGGPHGGGHMGCRRGAVQLGWPPPRGAQEPPEAIHAIGGVGGAGGEGNVLKGGGGAAHATIESRAGHPGAAATLQLNQRRLARRLGCGREVASTTAKGLVGILGSPARHPPLGVQEVGADQDYQQDHQNRNHRRGPRRELLAAAAPCGGIVAVGVAIAVCRRGGVPTVGRRAGVIARRRASAVTSCCADKEAVVRFLSIRLVHTDELVRLRQGVSNGLGHRLCTPIVSLHHRLEFHPWLHQLPILEQLPTETPPLLLVRICFDDGDVYLILRHPVTRRLRNGLLHRRFLVTAERLHLGTVQVEDRGDIYALCHWCRRQRRDHASS
mmetsp:Transcript_12507/g.37560  ORF Transcript_12507/g.37560 Transcript_12507/m.37560 type:complete len:404 (+) Transcript_12507:952-2163(+)